MVTQKQSMGHLPNDNEIDDLLTRLQAVLNKARAMDVGLDEMWFLIPGPSWEALVHRLGVEGTRDERGDKRLFGVRAKIVNGPGVRTGLAFRV